MVRPSGRLGLAITDRGTSGRSVTGQRSAGLAAISAPCLLILLISIAPVAGCARSLRNIDAARDAFAAGNLQQAELSLKGFAEKGSRFSDAASLDLAMVELASGKPQAAERRLLELRDRFDARPRIAPVHEAAALVTDDTARQFRPAGYEEVMIRAMLAICSIANDQFDAESYSLQALSKQAELAREADERGLFEVSDVYQPIALAPYLRGILREATHRDYDDAARAYQLVSAVRPEFAPVQEDIARASGGTHSAPGHGVLYVVACVGRGPVLQEVVEPTTTFAMQIASIFLNAATNDDADDGGKNRRIPALPNIASVTVPRVSLPACQVASVGVRVGGQLYGATQTLTDVGDLATRQNSAEMPWTIARAVVRRSTKEIAVAKVGDSLGLDGDNGTLFHFAVASAWSGVEQADTRCWGLLPREIQVLRAELPAGSHVVDLQSLGFSGAGLSPASTHRIEIIDGKNAYLVVIAPGDALYVIP